MGAIAGIVYPDAFQVANLVDPMLQLMSYRCRKPVVTHTFGTVQIGGCDGYFMTEERALMGVILDGVIHNAEMIKVLLEKAGYQLGSSTHTEIIARAYHHWGTECFKQLEGDFALAILDTRNEQLILARDRIGKQPLYWYRNPTYFLFASELKGLLATGIVPQTPALEGIATYLTLGYCPQDATPISGVNKLLPGYFLILKFNEQISIQPYWSYSSYFKNQIKDSPEQITSHLNDLIQQAVIKRIPQDQSIGCLVSGGLGSASIAYYLHRVCDDRRLTALTAGFEKDFLDDFVAANAVTEKLHMPHLVEQISPVVMLRDLAKIVWHLDEPLAEPNILSTWRLSRMASASTATVFSGMGYDELFAGHARYIKEEPHLTLSSFAYSLYRKFLRYLLVPLLHKLNRPEAYSLLRSARTIPWRSEYVESHAIFDEPTLAMAFPRLRGLFDAEVFLEKFLHIDRIKSQISVLRYLDIKTRLPDLYMLQVNRLTAAFGLSWETPFLDTQLIQYMATIPDPPSETTAIYLKSLLRGHLPSSVIDRPKRSRTYQFHSWANDAHVTKALSLLRQGRLVDLGLLSVPWLRQQLESDKRKASAFDQLFAVLILEVWMRLIIGRPLTPAAPDVSLLDLLRE